MISILFYYLILPFLFSWAIIRFIKKYGQRKIPADLSLLLLNDPIEKRFYRAIGRDASGLKKLGDFEKHEDAVDCIYGACEKAKKTGTHGGFSVLNDAGEILDLVES